MMETTMIASGSKGQAITTCDVCGARLSGNGTAWHSLPASRSVDACGGACDVEALRRWPFVSREQWARRAPAQMGLFGAVRMPMREVA